MKKKSKVIGKDYDKLEKNNLCDRIDYYGLIAKDGRIKIDTKDIRNSLLSQIVKLKIDIQFITFQLNNIDLIINVIGLEIY